MNKLMTMMKRFTTATVLAGVLTTGGLTFSAGESFAASAPHEAAHQVESSTVKVAAKSAGFAVKPRFAAGRTGDHVWLILSGADVGAGLVGAACSAVGVPAWACFVVGGIAQQVLNRWGPASNHGVWITVGIYWYNLGRVTGFGFY